MPNTYVRHPEDRKPKDGAHSQRVFVPRWIDPFPWVQGSSIEKMVMAELVRRGIYFVHTPQKNSIGGLVDPTWEPDFLFPQYHIWMEIQGAYFHTLPGAVERDSLRFAIIEAAGWKPIYWWEDDIRSRLQEIMNEVPEFYTVEAAKNVGYKTSQGYGFFEGDAPDTLKGLRAALAGRAKMNQKIAIRRRLKRRKKYGSN